MFKRSLRTECYGQTLFVYTEMAERSGSARAEGRERGWQVEDKSRSRPDEG